MSTVQQKFEVGNEVWAIRSPQYSIVSGNVLIVEFDKWIDLNGMQQFRNLYHIKTDNTIVIVPESHVYATLDEAVGVLNDILNAPVPSRTPTLTPEPTTTITPTVTPTTTPSVTPTRTVTPVASATLSV